VVAVLGSNQRPWDHRPTPGAEPELPGWVAGIEELSAVKAFGLADDRGITVGALPRSRGASAR